MSSAAETAPHAPSAGETAAGIFAWVRRDPLGALLLAVIAGVLVYFFGFYQVFMNGTQSTAEWTWRGWNDENDQVHCRFIVPIIALIFWLRRGDLMAAVKAPSTRGLAFVIVGIVFFVLAVRCLQPRIAIVALPLIVYGAAEFVGGRDLARIFIFPCLLMLFMVPIGGVIQGTVSLQLLASKTVGALCALLGIHVQIIGTTINVDGHSFEVAGGCSGIRSLMAMSMLAALYVYFTQKEAWKRWVIFGCSILFALVGNIARLFSVVLVAKWWNPEIAGGPYHDLSGLIVFFPCAVLVMVAFGNLLNRDWSHARARLAKTITAPDTEPNSPATDGEAGERKPASPISYDY